MNSDYGSPNQRTREGTLGQIGVDGGHDLPHTPLPRRSHSERLGQHRPPLFDHDLPPLPQADLPVEVRRQSMMALDRKRRLTASSYDNGRRRITTGGFTTRDNRYHQPPGRRGSESRSDQTEVIDLTTSSSPVQDVHTSSSAAISLPVPTRQMRTLSSGSRNYTPPRWQPDAEVSQCPICHRPFGFLFRRHHCRKCGRVVCNDCSPHRITIPKQYIVHQPGTDVFSASPSDARMIDMTGIEDEEDHQPGLREHRSPYPILGGGEKVRLCNPCVPDPQPELQTVLREGPLSSRPTADEPLRSAPSGLTSFPQLPNSLQRSGIRQSFSHSPHPGARSQLDQRPAETSDSSSDGHTSSPRWTHPASGRPSYPSPDPRHMTNVTAHSRYYSLDSRQAPLPPLPQPLPVFHFDPDGTRNVLHYSNGVRGSRPPIPSSSFSDLPEPATVLRPRIREEDICPICRHMLPPKGPDGDETTRENHIMLCISQHDLTAPSPASRSTALVSSSLPAQSQPRTQTFGNSGLTLPTLSGSSGSSSAAEQTTHSLLTHTLHTQRQSSAHVAQMLRFTATEKDCGSTGEAGGQVQECSICMVEYEVGDRLVRLECWCKFHEECIVEWFGRKAECPVHKLN